MEFQVTSVVDTRIGEENKVVPEGRVEQVCREWLVREDGVLAYKLQSQEIEEHYDSNRFRNRVTREDFQEAQTLQKTEEEEALETQQAYERLLIAQEEDDALFAKKIQQDIEQQEQQQQVILEKEDERLAKQLHEKERLRLERKWKEWELERELREVEKAAAAQNHSVSAEVKTASASNDSIPLVGPKMGTVKSAILSGNSREDTDFSDLYLPPPPGLSGDELKQFQEEQDAELASLLQEQETKRCGQVMVRDRQLAVEAQDRELARVLQEQERAKVRKAREKARHKALLQQQLQQREMERIEVSTLSPDKETNDPLPIGVDELYGKGLGRYDDNKSASTSTFLNHEVTNIATMIDPTYNHQKCSLDEQGASSPDDSIHTSSTSSPVKSPVHSAAGSPTSGMMNSDYYENLDDDPEGPVPPYMPIQGQRRTSSPEKTKKSKKKEGCRTQ